jgi:gluconate 2-dehydrogenase gamma chain
MIMSDDSNPLPLSRRALLKRAGVGGAAMAGAVVAGAVTSSVAGGDAVEILMPSADAASQASQAPRATREPLETLTPDEADTLDAIVARLVPTDASGPGATEARAVHYIDRALGGALASAREAYRAGLASVNAYARTSKGSPFAQLSAADQDAVLADMERNAAAGFESGSAAFFNLMLAHTLQGTFGDPHYGGNRNFVGWDLLGYPGIRLAVTASEQRLDARPSSTHMSAYDYSMFSTRRPARGD